MKANSHKLKRKYRRAEVRLLRPPGYFSSSFSAALGKKSFFHFHHSPPRLLPIKSCYTFLKRGARFPQKIWPMPQDVYLLVLLSSLLFRIIRVINEFVRRRLATLLPQDSRYGFFFFFPTFIFTVNFLSFLLRFYFHLHYFSRARRKCYPSRMIYSCIYCTRILVFRGHLKNYSIDAIENATRPKYNDVDGYE